MDIGILSILGAGFLIGMKHALDADHVVAVSTIVSESRKFKKAAAIGIRWGLGHTSTLFLAGLLVIIMGIKIPEKISLSLEFGVGLILVILGVSTIRGYFVKRVHAHSHEHNNNSHLHFHYHNESKQHLHEHQTKSARSPFLIGMVHGMAGSGALMLLVLGTVSSPIAGLLYVLVFGIGSTMGMLIISTLISLPFIVTANYSQRLNRFIALAAGSVSVVAGLLLMIGIASEMLV